MAAVVGAALVLAGCSSSSTLRSGDVQTSIAEGLRSQVGGEFTVTCPSGMPAEQGATFTCQVTDQTGGTTVTVTVTETDDQGGFTWKVTPNP